VVFLIGEAVKGPVWAPAITLRQRLLSIGDDYWIENDQGQRAFRVDGKALRERGDDPLATVRKALAGIRDRFSIEVAAGGELKTKGNIVDHEYEIERDGQAVARVSKRWFRVRDTYGVEHCARRRRRARSGDRGLRRRACPTGGTSSAAMAHFVVGRGLRGCLRSGALFRDVADGRLDLHQPLSGAITDGMEAHLDPDEVAGLPS
jgi:uncharacterized protein YxjI